MKRLVGCGVQGVGVTGAEVSRPHPPTANPLGCSIHSRNLHIRRSIKYSAIEYESIW